MLVSNSLFTWLERLDRFSVACLVFIECFLILSGYRWDFIRLNGDDNEDIGWIFCSAIHERLRWLFRINDRRRFGEWWFVNERAFDIDSEALAAMIPFVGCSDVGVDNPEHVSSSKRCNECDERSVVDDGCVDKNDLIFSRDNFSLDELWVSIVRLLLELFISSGLEFVRKYWSVKYVFFVEFRKLFERRNKRIVSIMKNLDEKTTVSMVNHRKK